MTFKETGVLGKEGKRNNTFCYLMMCFEWKKCGESWLQGHNDVPSYPRLTLVKDSLLGSEETIMGLPPKDLYPETKGDEQKKIIVIET